MNTQSTEDEVKAIEKMYDEAVDSFKRGDLEAVLGHWDDEAVYIWPAISPAYGKEEVRAAYQEFLANWTAEETYWLHEIEVAGDLAYVRFSTDLLLTPTKGGEPDRLNLHGIHIYRRQPDGSWRFKTVIATSVPLEAQHR